MHMASTCNRTGAFSSSPSSSHDSPQILQDSPFTATGLMHVAEVPLVEERRRRTRVEKAPRDREGRGRRVRREGEGGRRREGGRTGGDRMGG